MLEILPGKDISWGSKHVPKCWSGQQLRRAGWLYIRLTLWATEDGEWPCPKKPGGPGWLCSHIVSQNNVSEVIVFANPWGALELRQIGRIIEEWSNFLSINGVLFWKEQRLPCSSMPSKEWRIERVSRRSQITQTQDEEKERSGSLAMLGGLSGSLWGLFSQAVKLPQHRCLLHGGFYLFGHQLTHSFLYYENYFFASMLSLTYSFCSFIRLTCHNLSQLLHIYPLPIFPFISFHC